MPECNFCHEGSTIDNPLERHEDHLGNPIYFHHDCLEENNYQYNKAVYEAMHDL